MKIAIILVCLSSFLFHSCQSDTSDARPNIVIIFLDDSGWSDFQPFGENHIESPNLLKLAGEGCTYTSFYVPQAICSASRAALMTGCYPGRTKVFSAHPPGAEGLAPDFSTMGEVFQAAGYRTALFGKWHLGDLPGRRPHDRGFHESSGLMYSNDMWKHHPENPEFWGQFPIAFWENGAIIDEDVDSADQQYLTKWYTEYAVDFIERNADSSFLLYVPHSMPHVPLFCSPEFEGRTGQGLYADVIAELDWSVGQINKALKDNGIADNTLLVFSSDNGPWISYGNHAGFTPYREAKGTSFDGGIRSACVIKYPGHLNPGSFSDRSFFSIDLLPTLCRLTGVDLPENEIDGKDVWELIAGSQGAENPHEYYAFSNGNQFQGVISSDGKWKLHLPHPYRTLEFAGNNGQPGKYKQAETDTALFNLVNDPGETINLFNSQDDIARMMVQLAMQHKERFYGSANGN